MKSAFLSRGTGAIFILSGILFGASGCARPSQLVVPMEPKPTSQLDTFAFAGNLPAEGGPSLFVTPIDDQRKDSAAIGVNREDEEDGEPHVPIIAGPPGAAEMFRALVTDYLRIAGLNVADDQSAARRILKLELTEFWTDETNFYRSRVQAAARLTDGSGKGLWEGQVSGTNQRFGRSLSTDNYRESLSDATINMVENLLANPGFQAALKP